MEIICLASSSSGNCYVVKNDDTMMLVEAGIPYSDIIKKLNNLRIDITRISAVAVTHEHGDHARSIPELSKYMPVIASSETLSKIGNVVSKWPIKEWKDIAHVGSFWITGFYVDHDTEGAMGFIIYDQLNDERMIFINDTKLVRYNFSKHRFDYIFIECNHLVDAVAGDPLLRRKAVTHMSLDATRTALLSMNLEPVRAIYLMHLSDGNSDQALMVQTIKEATGVPTYACLKNGGYANG